MRGEIKVDMKVKIKMCKMNFSFIVSVLCAVDLYNGVIPT